MRRCALLLLLSKKDVKIHFENNAVFHESVNKLQFTSHTTGFPNSLLSNNTSIFTYALKFVQLGLIFLPFFITLVKKTWGGR